MRALNSWYNMGQMQWAVMAGTIVAGILIAKWLEYLSKPRYNKWSDWKRRR